MVCTAKIFLLIRYMHLTIILVHDFDNLSTCFATEKRI